MVEEEEGIRRFPAIEMQVVMDLGYVGGTHSCHGVDPTNARISPLMSAVANEKNVVRADAYRFLNALFIRKPLLMLR